MALGRTAANSGPPDLLGSDLRARGGFQLLDLVELESCHLLYQIQNRLLLEFADLYELHEPQDRRRPNPDHPPIVAEALPPRYR